MIKNFTTEERQEIYLHLLTLQLPDLLAALIAKRLDKEFIETDYLGALDKYSASLLVFEGFDWFDTEEGMDFWQGVYDDIESVMYGYESVPDCTDKAIYDEINAIPDDKLFGFVEKPEPKVSFWNKVKLFLGRIFYKV